MRIALQVFSTICLASLFLGGLLMVFIDFVRADDIADLQSNFLTGLLVSNLSPAMFRLAGVLWLLLAMGSVVGIVMVFLKNHRVGLITGITLFVLAALTVIVQPSLELAGNNDPRYTGYGIAFFGLGGIALLVILHTALKTSQAENKL